MFSIATFIETAQLPEHASKLPDMRMTLGEKSVPGGRLWLVFHRGSMLFVVHVSILQPYEGKEFESPAEAGANLSISKE